MLQDAGAYFLTSIDDVVDAPNIGDILVIDNFFKKDPPEKAFIYNGLATPFRVIERTKYYMQNKENHSYSKTCIYVERITEEDYFGKINK